MERSNIVKREVSVRRIDQFQKDLFEEVNDGEPVPADDLRRKANRHLSDEDFYLCLEPSSQRKIAPDVRDHLLSCSECLQEVSRLEELMAPCKDSSAIDNLQQRVLNRLAAQASPDSRSVEPRSVGLSKRLTKLFTVSFEPLFALQAASAAHTADAVRIEFPVTESGEPVPGLVGVLMRRNNEYYAKIEAGNDKVLQEFRDRQVQLTITDQDGQFSVLERKILIGVIVFIGTGLKKTYDLSAELL